jgi:hypothetical protein
VGSISSAGLVNGISLQVAKGSSVVGSISSAGLVNGSSLQVQNGGIIQWNVNNAGTISASTTNTINGIIINSGAISGVSTLTTTGNVTAGNGFIISAGHIRTTGVTPTISANCGSVTGTDNAGQFTVSGTPASCTVTFKSAYSTAPICVADGADTSGFPVRTSTTTTTATFTSTEAGPAFISGTVVHYICIGR